MKSRMNVGREVVSLLVGGRVRVVSFSLVVALSWSVTASASQTRIHSIEGAELLAGELDGAGITADGHIVSGPEAKALVSTVPGAVLGLARAGDGLLYVATGSPGRVYRVNGSELVELHQPDKPLVTAILPVGADTLVALTAPDAGADVINLSTKKAERIAAPVKLLLGGTVHDNVVYAVGGGDDGGVVLRLPKGATAFETIATTKEPLRSIAVRTIGSKTRIVVGGAEEGVVYEVVGASIRGLLDATPVEVTAVQIAPDGAVFAALADSEGRLSRQATAKAKDDGDEGDDKKALAKARRVKGGELWRIAADGTTRIVWQSKAHAPYALSLDVERDRLLVGTGPQGRVLSVGLVPTARASVLARRKGADEVTSLLVDKGAVLLGTAHGGSLLSLSTAPSTSSWVSDALDSEGRARYGLVRVLVEQGNARVSVRTGNTKDPDDGSWGPWSAPKAASAAGGAVDVEPAELAQIKIELAPGAAVSGALLAYLSDNRPPELATLDVLAPGWRVTPNPRQPPESRAVTFGEKPFARFLDRRGAQNPTMEERPYGKQTFDVGYRTIYAYAEDPDKDALVYRFSLGRQQNGAMPTTWKSLGEWSEEPFVSIEASRLADGDYRVKVEVSDSPTNGAARARTDSRVSSPFVVSHRAPVVTAAAASPQERAVRIAFDVAAALPLVSVRCSTDLSEWLPLDPKDGILDAAQESFSTTLPASKETDAVSCEIYDEALNFQRFDVPVR
jgi:hypothetical protein